MKVCFSGTFNILHSGHKHLLDVAINTAGKNGILYIGVTDGVILKILLSLKLSSESSKPVAKEISLVDIS